MLQHVQKSVLLDDNHSNDGSHFKHTHNLETSLPFLLQVVAHQTK